MSSRSQIPAGGTLPDPPPDVSLEVRLAGGRPATYALGPVGFVVGTVPGCDLRLSGTDLPALVCLLARRPNGLALRRLAHGAPLLVNGRPAGPAPLADGDRLTIGTAEILVHIHAAPADADMSRAQLHEAVAELRRQMVRFQQEREQFERERQAQTAGGQREQREQRELSAARQEVLELRRQINERYQERNERLTRLQADNETVRQRLAEREQQLSLLEQHNGRLQQQLDARQAELDREAARLTELARKLDQARREFDQRQATGQGELERRSSALGEAERQLGQRERDLEAKLRVYQADVLRLDRQRGDVEKQHAEARAAAEEAEQHKARLATDSAELEEQVVQLDAWRVRLTETEERLTRQGQQQQALASQLAQRAASLEGQQATLAALRTRLERLRDDLRVREQQLDEQGAAQTAEAQRLAQERQEVEQRRTEMEADRRLSEAERQQLAERSALMENAVRQLRQAQERLVAEEQRLATRGGELEAEAARLTDESAILNGRQAQLAEAQERLDAERQALRERSVELTRAEQAREALQEQLRRRSEELTTRHKALDEQAAEQARQRQEYADGAARLDALQEEWRRRSAELDQRQAALDGREQAHRTQGEQLAGLSRGLHEEQERFRQEQREALEYLGRQRDEYEAMRREAAGLLEQLPDLELRVGTGLDRLGQAREQLRDHLAEVHQYIRGCHDELEKLRGRVQADVDRLAEQEQALRRGQDEHRLALVAFRQQLIDWQGQIAEMKRSLAVDATRLDRKQARVEEQARAIDASSQRLAREAEALEEQQREVMDRRQEVDRHLGDMREWYRRKLRDLAGIPVEALPAASAPPAEVPAEAPAEAPAPSDGDDNPLIPIGRGILTMAGPVDAGDRRLGETLQSLQLIDADALTALLAEARRQRRSLRQVLLASGVVTLYQLALIEAGNVDGLVLGPVRVIDRLRVTPLEAVYRVFDPRRGTEAVLRHLAEAPMHDAVRPDEFRQRFGQAVLADPHLAATLEVLEINGRPAALEEWLSGLPATDWPPLAAAPGVCYRLLTQAARGLNTAHRAGLIHGHLGDAQLLLNGEGVLKICGLGEPPWLAGAAEDAAHVHDDLRALGAIVSGWCTPSGVRRGPRARPLPEALVSVLYRLNADGDAAYPGTAELLEDLEKAAGAIPPNAEAWDRLLRYVREHGTSDAALRRSA